MVTAEDRIRVTKSSKSFTDGLLSHELLHVEQYLQLGIPPFADL